LKIRKIFFNSLLILASLVLSVALFEGALRLSIPKSRWEFFDASMDWKLDRQVGWVQQPNLDIISDHIFPWTVHFQTNEDGLAPPQARRSKPPGLKRIMIFGDSTVIGRWVPQDKTVTAQLQRMLRDKGLPVEVINAGVQGYSTDQVLLRIEQLAPIYKPDVVLYCLCDNDFGGNARSEAYGQAKPRFIFSKDGGLELIPPKLQDKINHADLGLRTMIQYSALYQMVRPALTELRAKLGGWEERNLMGLANEIYYRPQEMAHIDWKLFTTLVMRMQEVSLKNQASFLFYSHPSLDEVWEPYIKDTETKLGLKPGQYDNFALEKRLVNLAAENNLIYLPHVSYFMKRQSQGPFHLLPRDPHCNPKGYKLTAEILTDYCYNLLSKN
jgi:lysophospholipase L1-like esterase